MLTAKVNVRLAIQVPSTLDCRADCLRIPKVISLPTPVASNDRDTQSISLLQSPLTQTSAIPKKSHAPVPEPATETPSACSAC